jgi:hypothetical protein
LARRYRSIKNLERHLHGNGTRIVKFFLHLSKEEQRKRFLARIDEPEKTGNSAQPTSQKENSGTALSDPTVQSRLREASATGLRPSAGPAPT